MTLFSEFADRIEQDVPLGPLTWYRLGGPARWMFHPRDFDDLAGFVSRAREDDLPLKVLGGGANVLIRDDGFNGVVVRLDSGPFRSTAWDSDGARVGAGVDLMPLTRECNRRGRAGLEFMAGIPGTIGGAVRMNAGGRFGEFGAAVVGAEVLNEDGAVETWTHDRLAFGYRKSAVREEIVLSASLRLHEDDPATVAWRYDDCFSYKQKSQPLVDRSAGCIFKNPTDKSAGALIDSAGMKGYRCGTARVSTRHANFIVTDAGATATDVLRLIDLIRDNVAHVHGLILEIEVDIW